MNLVDINHEGFPSFNGLHNGQTSRQSDSPPATDDTFGDPIISPRLGDDYQVEVPSLVTKSDVIASEDFPKYGLIIPVMWVNLEGSKRDEREGFCMGSSTQGFESLFNINRECMSPDQQIDKDMGFCPLPESPITAWSDAELQSFLLGLYIFGKNLVQVKRFTGCKEMGNILSFYYGKFYRSNEHLRWVECRKSRSKKCIYGHRIFTGWRQQELLSRILPKVSKEVQDSLLVAAKTFNEGRSTLEEFVFTLKNNAGIDYLIEAVGIGREKQDLTGFLLDPNRKNHIMPSRVEVPTGKACSSLESSEIIKFLSGDFRLSKAKSNDLFWEAVWPRLLARGWHSEIPRNTSSKKTLVFLIPGIRKFSRRKLVKGEHYFDSVTDVLNKVASDPSLLKLKVGVKANSISSENLNNISDHQSKLPNRNVELLKFTVVDTSLVENSASSFNFRELRSLPSELTGQNAMEETDSGSSSELLAYASSEETSNNTGMMTAQPEKFQKCSDVEIENDHFIVDILAPPLKRQRLTVCKQEIRNGSHKLILSQEKVVKSEEKASSRTSLSSAHVGNLHEDNLPQQALFDLNEPQFELDFGTSKTLFLDEKCKFDVSEEFLSNVCINDINRPSLNDNRRHGSRNRLPSMKALEAFASGFLKFGRNGAVRKGIRARKMGSRSRLFCRKVSNSSLTPLASNLSVINPRSANLFNKSH
ncbi:hypothetical protein AXF42_Ash001418 [Apostasia shenzhenica]|uniref:SANT domain-containing protein n=1 Tax=Apostasia shenzhenica TaxID=1088818 RepID=A0A2I0AUU7_9ASPA|nr:hypothetical protein AXF42_Ash001418 [Apostasia shenzhenica]